MLRKYKTVEDETRQDKTRQDGQNPAHHISRNRQNKKDRTQKYLQDNDPRLGRIECFGRARLWKTRQARRTKHDTRHLSNRRDPRLGCSKGFGRVIYGRQDKIAQPQRSQPRMQRMLRKSQTMEDKARQDKTDKTRHATSRPTAEVPASDASKASEEHDYGRQDKIDSRSKTMKDKTKTRVLRVCAIEMHLDIAQELVRKDHAPRFVPARAVEMHVDMSQETLHTAIYREKCPSPEPRRKLCASLRSRNALGNFTRAT